MTEHLILNDGHGLPEIGFGTYPLRGDDGYRAVRSALDAGYRLIDSAVNYGNEEEVGRAIRDWLKDTGTDRDEIVVQTKLPGRHHEFEAAMASGRDSLATMGLDRLDVLLIHWPNPSVGKFKEAWRALVELREAGVVRTVGVSNFTAEHLAAIIEASQAKGVAVILAGMEAPPNNGPEYAARFRAVYKDLAETYDVPLIPFLLEGVAGQPALNQADGIHPNAEGARRVADIVWQALEPVLAEEMRKSR